MFFVHLLAMLTMFLIVCRVRSTCGAMGILWFILMLQMARLLCICSSRGFWFCDDIVTLVSMV